jgi:hypothetical protein
MSKKIENILEKTIPRLIQKRMELSFFDNYVTENELDKDIEEITTKLKNCSMRDLSKVKEKINDNRLLLMNEIMNSQNQGIEIDESLFQTKDTLDLQHRIVTKTIEVKQEYQKQFTHPVERNIVQHGFFSSTTPNEDTLKRLRTKDGIIEQVRNGFRRLYYRNENGNLLTTYDTKVFIGLLKLWETKGMNRTISFEFKEILREIESDLTGGEYETIQKSLENLARTSIIMEEYLDPKTGKKTRTRIHHPIQNADIIYERGKGIAKATLEFNNYLHDSLLAGNYVLINMGLFNDLATPTSKNLYLYIVNELATDQQKIAIDPLIEHLGLHGSTRTKSVNLLKEAFAELKDFDVIKHWDVEKEGRVYKNFIFTPSDWLMNQPILIEHPSTYLDQ